MPWYTTLAGMPFLGMLQPGHDDSRTHTCTRHCFCLQLLDLPRQLDQNLPLCSKNVAAIAKCLRVNAEAPRVY